MSTDPDTFDRVRSQYLLDHPEFRHSVDDVIAEAVAEMTWCEVDWELRTRRPKGWVPPEDDGECRAMLVEIFKSERTKGRKNDDD
jgi:hypothetical protein